MWKKFRSWPTGGQVAVWVVLALVVLGIIGAAVGGNSSSSGTASGTTETPSAPDSGSSDATSADQGGDSGSNVATDDYTPHVGQGTPVVVDELTWRIQGPVSSSSTLGDNEFTSATANGRFVVVPMLVKNGKNETVTVTSNMVKLVAAGKEYESDTEGELALLGSSQKSFFLEDIGPDVSQTGTVVFDVPPAAITSKPEVCIGELGFGPSRGCIALTRISS